MIKFKPRSIDRLNQNTPIVSGSEIDEYAAAILSDYKPELLHEPGPINYLNFLENYLGLRIEYHDIYNEDEKQPILAMTAFEKTEVEIFNKEDECVDTIVVPKWTIVMDKYLLKKGKESMEMFTGLHEGGHVLMHSHVFSRDAEWDSDYDEDGRLTPLVCCRKKNIERLIMSKKPRTAEQWREHQANYFAAAVAMPNATFRPFVYDFLRENDYYKTAITLGVNDDWDILAEDILPDAISEVYGVSKTAARIKLVKAGFVFDGGKPNRSRSRFDL